jgi:hypothetical protein
MSRGKLQSVPASANRKIMELQKSQESAQLPQGFKIEISPDRQPKQ